VSGDGRQEWQLEGLFEGFDLVPLILLLIPPPVSDQRVEQSDLLGLPLFDGLGNRRCIVPLVQVSDHGVHRVVGIAARAFAEGAVGVGITGITSSQVDFIALTYPTWLGVIYLLDSMIVRSHSQGIGVFDGRETENVAVVVAHRTRFETRHTGS